MLESSNDTCHPTFSTANCPHTKYECHGNVSIMGVGTSSSLSRVRLRSSHKQTTRIPERHFPPTPLHRTLPSYKVLVPCECDDHGNGAFFTPQSSMAAFQPQTNCKNLRTTLATQPSPPLTSLIPSTNYHGNVSIMGVGPSSPLRRVRLRFSHD